MRRGLYSILILGLLSVLLVMVVPASAASENLTNSSFGQVDDSTMTRSVTASLTEPVYDVNVTIDFHKIDESDCSAPDTGSSYANEISFRLTSPAGTTVNLAYDDDSGSVTYPNDSDNASRVVVTFDDSADTLIGGNMPVSGTFHPAQSLSAFNYENPQGDWTLTLGDNANADDLCFYSFTLMLNQGSPQFDVFYPGDDRINHHAIDRAAPVAIYCQSYGIQVYDVDGYTGKGSNLPIISLSYAEVEAMGVPTDAPLLLAQYEDTTLWRLTTGEFQVNAYYEVEWKPWAFLWDACPMTTGRHLNN